MRNYLSCIINDKMNGLNEWCLRIVYSDKASSFKKLLEKHGSAPMHTRNLQITFPYLIFHYNLRHNSYFPISAVKFVYHGTKSLSNLGPRI